MREKLRSQRGAVISLPKPWDSRRNREIWQVCNTHDKKSSILVYTCACPYYFFSTNNDELNSLGNVNCK